MSITAHEWITTSSVDAEVLDRWPDYRVVLIAADRVDVADLVPVAAGLLDEAQASCVDLNETDPHIARWHQAYRDFGIKPRDGRVSVDALMRRATSENGLPRINTLVDLYNAISVLYRVPIGGEDLDRYTGPARLVVSVGEEPFHTTAHGEPIVDCPDRGEPIWVDDVGVTCRRWNWRQTSRTAIDATTTRVGFIIDSLDAPDHAGAQRAVEHLIKLIPSASIQIVDRS